MKIFNFFKSIPFLFTLIVIIFLNITNQKQSTKLKILIWNTPSLPIGTYLAISAGTGFIFSYTLSTYLANLNKSQIKKDINNDFVEKFTEDDFEEEPKFEEEYVNTLIERDPKHPAPTINASFRVIGKTKKRNIVNENNPINDYDDSNFIDEFEYKNYPNELNSKVDKNVSSVLNDWEDDSYTNW